MAHDTPEEDIFTGRIDYALWRRILLFARPYKGHLLGICALGVLVGLFDVLLPLLTRGIVDELTARAGHARLRPYLLAYAAIIVCFASSVLGFILLAGRIATSIAFDVRQATFAKLQELPFSFYDRKAVGWLMARLTSDCSSLSRIMGWALLDFAWGTFVLLLTASVMFAINWRLALIVLTITPLLVFVSRFFQVRLLLTSRAVRKANSQTTAAFNEGIVGVRTSKSLVREERNLEEFSQLTGEMYRHALSNALYSALFLPLVVSICSIGVGLALWRGGLSVGPAGLSLGTLVMFLQFAAFLANPIQELANTLTMVQGAQASAERIQGLLDTDVQIKDSPEVVARIEAHGRASLPASREVEPRPGSAGASPSRDGDLAPDGHPARIETIEFRNVTFAYDSAQTVLRDFNLTVHAGHSIALVGPTGGGKTTIVGLACRFYEPTSGQVLINGLDYRQRSLHWLQSQLGMVLQQPHLFSGTVRENIRYGRLTATDDQVEQAARLTGAHDFITAMKDGYNAAVGEGGNQLSTGQKQLIALARAILADPQVFVMDEATSSVDTQTERAIQSAVERVLAGRISFVIAHRLSTIRRADRILFIESGRILEDGSHHDLLAQRGRYYDLYTNQFTQEKEERVLEYTAAPPR